MLQVLIQAGQVCSRVLKFGFMILSSRYGLQTMSEGGGMANATIIERLGKPMKQSPRAVLHWCGG